MPKRTPLYGKHVALGGIMVDFAGWELPVQYSSGIIAEHTAVRTKAGLFDVSHMGEFMFEGAAAEKTLDFLLTNKIAGMYDGQAKYALLCADDGGTVDDVLVYRFHGEKFMMVVNASNIDKDFGWISAKLPLLPYANEVKFTNLSDGIGQIALQGPLSDKIAASLVPEELLPAKYYTFKENVPVGGVSCLVSRTGYTGENGFEFYCPAERTVEVYEALAAAGEAFGAVPAGLGARDTLRLEAAMPLYGHELSAGYPATEAGLNFAIKTDKAGFVGKDALVNIVTAYERVGATVTGKGVVREGAPVFTAEGEEIGFATSGTFSPTLGAPIAMLRLKLGSPRECLYADVRGRKVELTVTPLPFYKKTK